ncbi:MAG: glutamate formimidoyltransferase [Armatimonadota bacterium]|nr:glutamate formimidoyltransferase [Armatimonadota bacterium]
MPATDRASSSKVIQCVPNFSEGRRPDVVGEIARALRSGGSKVIDSSLDPDHNRSVITFIGDPDSIRKSALAGVGKAVELIDMRSHHGAHPRVGAVDVIPIVPIRNVTMQDCVDLSCEIGAAIADEFRIPVYFYEESANAEHRRNLANIRRGGYEKLVKGRLDRDRTPDLGPDIAHPTAGATIIGARGPLIAFNVDLRTSDFALAQRIAAEIRRCRDEGRGMAGVKAMAVDLVSRGIVQVSTNITQPDKTTMYDVYDFVRGRAEKAGVEIERSELIGAVRLDDTVRSAAESMKLEGFDETRIVDWWLE